MLRQLLTENVILAGLGGAGGLLLAFWGIDAVKALGPQTLPRLSAAAVDLRIAGFAIVLSAIVGIVFGLLPAVRATRQSPSHGLKDGRGTARSGRLFSTRNVLVASQVAVTVALLVSAGLAGRSLGTMLGTDMGFDIDRLLTVGFVLPPDRFPTAETRDQWSQSVIEQVKAVPGVEYASTVNFVPFNAVGPALVVGIPGRSDDDASTPIDARELVVNPGYFRTLGLPLIAGRDFDARDREDSQPVIVISQDLAQSLWGDDDAIGRTLNVSEQRGTVTASTVIGIVAPIRQAGASKVSKPQLYRAYGQQEWGYSNLVVRAQPGVAPDGLISAVHRALWSVDPDRPLFASITSKQYLEWELAEPQFSSFLLVFFSGFGLLLAIVGIYSVLAVSVRQRQREIGIRLALGAAQQRVRRLVVHEGMTFTALGVVLGLPLAVVAGRLLTSQLVGIEPNDPLTFISVALLILLASYAATAIPAARASRVDPMTTLREE